MADSGQTLNPSSGFKAITCRSKRIVNEINTVVTSTINDLSDSNVFWSHEEKEQCKSRFKEIFSSSALPYLNINGEVAANLDDDEEEETSEVEQVNQERADYYRERLPQDVYDQLKELVNRRKQAPYSCARHLATQCKHQQSYLVKLKYAESSRLSHTCSRESDSTASSASIVEECSMTAKSLSDNLISLTKLVGETKKLKSSLDMLDSIGGTRTDKVLFENTPRKTSVESNSCTPLKEHLSRLNQTPTPVRTSARLTDQDKLRNRKLVSSTGYTLRNLPPR